MVHICISFLFRFLCQERPPQRLSRPVQGPCPGPTPEGRTHCDHSSAADACRLPVSIYENRKISGESRNLKPNFLARAGRGLTRNGQGENRLGPCGRPEASALRRGNGGCLQARTMQSQDGPLAESSSGTGNRSGIGAMPAASVFFTRR